MQRLGDTLGAFERALLRVDVDVAAVPAHDPAGRVAQRLDAAEEPVKASVPPAQAKLHLERFAGPERVRPALHHLEEVFRMVRRLPAPTERLVRRLTGELVPALVVPVDPAVGVGREAHHRNRLGKHAEAAFGVDEFCAARP